MEISKYKQMVVDFLTEYNIMEFVCEYDYLITFADNTTDFEDIMYYFYCVDIIKNHKHRSVPHQHIFNINRIDYDKYENEANKYLRKEKLKIICSK